jgi:hypothetical protein
LIHPDGRTLGLLAGFAAITLAALGAVLTTARRKAVVPLEGETADQLAGRV